MSRFTGFPQASGYFSNFPVAEDLGILKTGKSRKLKKILRQATSAEKEQRKIMVMGNESAMKGVFGHG